MNQKRATGTFEVSLQPLASPDSALGATLGRMSIEKQFAGDLVGRAKGEMLSAMTAQEGSAGYVAIERVTGALQGRQGSFVLQHSGIMQRGEQQLSIVVVPDSGTDQLAGITGSFTLNIVDGKHFYVFDYAL
ncbi:MAG: DUF3224 domain-containing protein [Caldilineaceae bacterium]